MATELNLDILELIPEIVKKSIRVNSKIFDYATIQVTSSQTSSTCNVSSMPTHLLKLKVGVSIMLRNNQCLRNELLNGTTFTV